ncbi:modifier of mdg4 [Calliphora vicina]|uniref:modifier of mdg4 n=1 Tax=Calliphora vicina TaxID=7373 RepID=UPI00325BC382
MKLVVDGHHFRYSFRKGKYTIFQCCYKENKEECLVRVVTDQKLVYPLDGEHIHFVQATDKSVTSVKFTPGKEPEPNVVTITEVQDIEPTQPEHVALNIGDLIPQPIQTNVKEENTPAQETLEFTTELVMVGQKSPTENKSKEVTSTEDPNEFREKIKKRLQKALLGKKKQ